jgi:hypothetical protein
LRIHSAALQVPRLSSSLFAVRFINKTSSLPGRHPFADIF